jgi:hypothetical protein
MRLTQIILVGLVAGTLTLAGCASRARRAPRAVAVAATGTEPERAKAPPKKLAIKAARAAAGPAKAAAVVAAPRAPAGNGVALPIEGYGADAAKAEQAAVQDARRKLAAFLQQQQPPLTVALSDERVRRLIREGGPNPLKDVKVEELREDLEVPEGLEALKDLETIKCWSGTLAVTPQDYREFVRLDREARHRQLRAARMEWLAKGLAVVLAGLVALLICIRVGQWATGLWTRRVRVVVACLLVAAVAGLLCLS